MPRLIRVRHDGIRQDTFNPVLRLTDRDIVPGFRSLSSLDTWGKSAIRVMQIRV